MKSSRFVSGLVPVAAALLVYALVPIEPRPRKALAIAVWMVLAWLLEWVHPAIVGFLGCFLFWAVAGIAFEASFAGFGGPLPWFLYGVLVLVAIAQQTGISTRMGRALPPGVRASFPLSAGVLLVAAYLLGLVVPSALARGAMLLLLAVGLGDGLPVAGSPRRLLAVVAVYGAVIFDQSFGPSPIALIPWHLVAGATCLAAATLLARRTAPDETVEKPAASYTRPLTTDARNAAILLGIAFLFWLTTSLHHISPAMVGLAAGLAAYFPGIGVRPADKTTPDPLAIIIAGAALSIPAALVDSKASGTLMESLHAWTLNLSMLPQATTTYWAGVVHQLFAPNETTRQTVEMSKQLAAAVGPMATAGVVGASAAATKFGLYQSPALILAFSAGRLESRDVLRIGLALLVVASIAVAVIG